MNLKAIITELQLNILAGQNNSGTDVTGAYTSDLLSDVIANSKKNDLWITLQTHQNIIAVAKLKELAGIIIVNNREPNEETVQKAEGENVPLLVTSLTAYEASGKLYSFLSSND